MDTDQKADILGKNKFLFYNKYKKVIFISSGALLISLLLLFIFSKIGKNDIANEEKKKITVTEEIDKLPTINLDVDKFETEIEINGELVEIFYYCFGKDKNWTTENRNFEPLITSVRLTHEWDVKNDVVFQEFYWNDNFYTYDEYKTQKESLYGNHILESSFIFIRKSKLDEKSNTKISDPFQLIKQEEAKRKANAKKKADAEAKKKADAEAKKKADADKKNKEEEESKLNKANKELKTLTQKILDNKREIQKLNLNNEKIVKFFDEANTNYNDQKSEFFDLYKGYNGKIPDLLPTTDIPKGILELNNELFTKNNELKAIKTKASNDYKNAEKIQTDAATFLNNSKVKFKPVEDLRNEFEVIYNKDNKELVDRCKDDLGKINRAKDNIDFIEKKSDAINNEFKSIKEYLKKINELSEKSLELSELIKENVELKREKKRK